jgi:hypothetical protein
MLKKIGIRGKFILITSVVTVALLTTMALVIISNTNKSQSRQANAFIDLLKAEHGQEEKLLRNGLLQCRWLNRRI